MVFSNLMLVWVCALIVMGRGRPKKSHKYRELTNCERGQIIGFKKAGWSERKIAREVGCSQSQVNYTWNKFQVTNDIKNRSRSGRPRCTTVRQDRRIKFTSLSNRKLG